MSQELPHRLERTLTIQADPEVVFSFFTDTSKWASWWGAGSTIDATPGGAVKIVYPGGTEAIGSVVEVQPPRRIVFTYGYTSGKMIPPGGSRVTIALEPADAGTRLTLTHEFADSAIRDQHVQGWRYQLSLFANVVADAQNANAATAIDAWFDAWGHPDAAHRSATLTAIGVPGVRFKDRFSSVEGVDDLLAHLAAAAQHMPGIRLARTGDVRHCQGMVLADWAAKAADGQPRGSGTNVFLFGADGRIESVTGFWNPSGK